MCVAEGVPAGPDAGSTGFTSAAEALRTGAMFADFLNSPDVADLEPAALGAVLVSIGEIQAKLAAAHAAFLRRFDGHQAHYADGYGTSSAWLAAMTRLSRKDAKAAVRQMRVLGERPLLALGMVRGEISDSWAREIAAWLKRLPEELRDGTEEILAEAAAAGACLEDLATIVAHALAVWQAEHPDEDPDGGFPDRYLKVGATFGGAGVIRGDLTPECTAAVTAVLQALGKKAGPEDHRNEAQRFHDALQLACELLMRARMVPDRAGADTQVVAHIPLSHLRQMPGARGMEDAWVRALLGEDGYLTGKDAEAAACDATTVPVVTGQMDLKTVDQMIDFVLAAYGHAGHAGHAGHKNQAGPEGTPPAKPSLADLSPGARQALRHGIARLAIDLVSGPAGIAAVLRTGLLDHPWNTPSLPLDIGYSDSIPSAIRRAVLLRDRHRCAWPRCGRPAAWCDVHHIVHKKDGGKTSVSSCVTLCGFHHDVCIHRWGWQIVVHPDGTTSVYGPAGQVQHSHSPPPSAAEAA